MHFIIRVCFRYTGVLLVFWSGISLFDICEGVFGILRTMHLVFQDKMLIFGGLPLVFHDVYS